MSVARGYIKLFTLELRKVNRMQKTYTQFLYLLREFRPTCKPNLSVGRVLVANRQTNNIFLASLCRVLKRFRNLFSQFLHLEWNRSRCLFMISKILPCYTTWTLRVLTTVDALASFRRGSLYLTSVPDLSTVDYPLLL